MERKIKSTMDLVNAIYQMKDKRNMTFEEIEKRVQISPGLISRWKREKTGPNLEVIIEILETLDMDLYVRESDFTHMETERSRDEPLDNSPISKLQMELMLAISLFFLSFFFFSFSSSSFFLSLNEFWHCSTSCLGGIYSVPFFNIP